MRNFLAYGLITPLTFAACGKADPPPPAPKPAPAPVDAAVAVAIDAPPPPPDAAPAASTFDQLSREEKTKLMKEVVTPQMKAAFQKHDRKAFAVFNCKTCHGPNPQAVKFEMPNPDLPRLDDAALRAGEGDPVMLKFMADVVTPTMAKILGAELATETNHEGFSCLSCHTLVEPPDPTVPQ